MTIRKARGRKGFNLISKKGRKLNKRPMSRRALQKREQQIRFFKNKGSSRRRR